MRVQLNGVGLDENSVKLGFSCTGAEFPEDSVEWGSDALGISCNETKLNTKHFSIGDKSDL